MLLMLYEFCTSYNLYSVFFPKPKRIWLYCRGSDQSIFCHSLNDTAFFNEMI